MNDRKPLLYLLLGAWLSFTAIVMAGTAFLPAAPEAARATPALLYRIAANEELTPAPAPVRVGRSVLADLDAMTITLLDGETEVGRYLILSKGKEGTFWETPTGTYVIGAKEPKHFSSIGGTWMPYSMQFYGNFFIHGWPTYPDGTPVAKGYSGGCIRLATEDAREVYLFAESGTKVSVVGGLSSRRFATSSRYYLRAPELSSEESWGTSSLPTIAAPSFVVADVDSGEVLWQRAPRTPVPAKELVALVTALTALETVDQYKLVRMGDLLLGNFVSRKQPLGAPDEVTLGSLIYPLLFDANDTAAKAFAAEHGRKQFARSMNQKSVAIGMDETVWAGALSTDLSTTTARDLLTLLRYVEAHKRFLLDVTRSTERTFVGADGTTEFHWDNKNPWLLGGDSAYRGGLGILRPNGSGSALLLFALPVSEFSERTIAVVVPDSSALLADVALLRAFILDHYVFGIERQEAAFIREPAEPTPSLLYQIKRVLDLSRFLDEEVEYEREV